MDVSTPPSLDLACPQAKAELDNHDRMFREREKRDRGIDKTKYGHDIMFIVIVANIYHINSHNQVTIHSQL